MNTTGRDVFSLFAGCLIVADRDMTPATTKYPWAKKLYAYAADHQ